MQVVRDEGMVTVARGVHRGSILLGGAGSGEPGASGSRGGSEFHVRYVRAHTRTDAQYLLLGRAQKGPCEGHYGGHRTGLRVYTFIVLSGQIYVAICLGLRAPTEPGQH